VISSLIIKYLCHPDDREVVDQTIESTYMQYFLGYSSFVNKKPFEASLFVKICKRVGMDVVNSINERIVELRTYIESKEALEGNVSRKMISPLSRRWGRGFLEALIPQREGIALMPRKGKFVVLSANNRAIWNVTFVP
jgi:hypothetical protein